MVDFFKKEGKSKTPKEPCHILLVEKTDRLYRNLKDWVTIDDLNLDNAYCLSSENVMVVELRQA